MNVERFLGATASRRFELGDASVQNAGATVERLFAFSKRTRPFLQTSLFQRDKLFVRNDSRFERLGLRRVLELRRHNGSLKNIKG